MLVPKESRNTGIGKDIVQTICDYAIEKNKKVVLQAISFEENAGIERFQKTLKLVQWYESFGFIQADGYDEYHGITMFFNKKD